MGIYSRDYVREDSGRVGGWGDDIPAIKWLIIVSVVAFLLQFVTVHRPAGDGSYVADAFALRPDWVLVGQVWRLVTYVFLNPQPDLIGLVFNMLGLWWFGSEMERLYGTREFTVFYLAGALVSGVGLLIWQLAIGIAAPLMGATGAVLAVMTLYATHFPRQKIYVMGIIPIEIRWLLVFYVAYDSWPVFLALNGQAPPEYIAHATHVSGILFGWLYRRYRWHLSDWFDFSFANSWLRRMKRNKAQQSLRVFEPEPEADLEGELDRILAKIHEHGSSSLTDREQAILTRASQQYKNKQ